MATEKKKGTWVWGLAIVGAFLLLVVLVLPALQSPHCHPRYMTCLNNQKNLALALHNYLSSKGRFPPAYVMDDDGKPLYSWRVLILPYIERADIWDEYHHNEPWDSPHNKKLLETDIRLFRCSAAKHGPNTTNHVLVTGPGTIWEDGKACSMDDISYPDQTLMMIEVADSGIHWAEPVDLKIDDIDPRFLDEDGNFKTNHPGRVIVTFADGHQSFLPEEKVLKALKEWSQIQQEKKENFEY